MVLTATVMSMTHASPRRSLAAKRLFTVTIAVSETTNDAIIALISLHALMRHQYQRRISTSPVPEPRARRNFQAPSTVVRFIVIATEQRKSSTVAQRDTVT